MTETNSLDLISMYPGAIEGGIEQIIVDIIPKIARRDDVRAWAFDRRDAPAPVVVLLLDLEREALADVIDACEAMLSSSLRDDPGFVLHPLLESSDRSAPSSSVPWGVSHTPTGFSDRDDEVRRQVALDQAISSLALRVLTNVRAMDWDRKTVAPSLLHHLLRACHGQDADSGRDAYALMQRLLDDDSDKEALIRRFRMKAHQLAHSGAAILLHGANESAFRAELADALVELGVAIESLGKRGDKGHTARVWRRLAAGIGFTSTEAAYIACLTSVAASEAQP